MKRRFMVTTVLAFALMMGGCAQKSGTDESGKVKVTATIGQIGDAVKQVGGDHVEVQTLMGPGVDPHLYKAKQSDIGKLQEADLIFYSGLHLEGKMLEVLEKVNETKPAYAISESIPKERLRADEASAAAVDPHVWFDIDLWKIAVAEVRDGLIKEDPTHEEEYRENTEAYFDRLDELKEYAEGEIGSIPEEQRVLVTAHDAFHYFGDAYDMEVMGLQGLSTDAEFGLGDVQGLVEILAEREIKAVFVESSISEKSITAVMEGVRKKGKDIELGGELYSDAMGKEGTETGTYIGMYKHNVDTIVKALK
ncbi:metal ABC transporter solute-binding protein, Zn/Mn family [Rossellomorea marisflavi]|uniref:metal ABC transporter solute-binding protein, Zn/Mn family n=1 Tax=Rossellomorea TaxID=2837508 RepID=UPI00064F07C3|nr:zinc ABC transporter substrate-binding protein [Rossellomorea marisflavi]KML01513.1 manganese transporter [Rossellomorea marisflavi]